MIFVSDVNTIWRHRPFAAMAKLANVVAFSPGDWWAARQRTEALPGILDVVEVILPPSWASRTAWIGQRILWNRMKNEALQRNGQVDCLVVTSPHYLTLLGLLPESIKTVYYASDDYRSYQGWSNMAELEKQIVRQVDHSFFISEGLAERAYREYDLPNGRISVSMNGTEDRFFPEEGEALPLTPPCGELKRPVAGIVGGICDRLDFELLQLCADLPEIGTLLLVGPLPNAPPPALQKLLRHPKCVSVGSQSHGSLQQWFKCLDVGLIPYVESELNRFCSPMRLFDHLASGQPIVATAACAQVGSFEGWVEVCRNREEFVDGIKKAVVPDVKTDLFREHSDLLRKQTWAVRAREMLDIIRSL